MGWKSGDWKVTCDLCSKEILASESKQRWDGFIVCEDDWEPRHPLDFIRTPKEDSSVPFSRPEPPWVFIQDTGCSPLNKQGLTGSAVAGCAIPSYKDTYLFNQLPPNTFNGNLIL